MAVATARTLAGALLLMPLGASAQEPARRADGAPAGELPARLTDPGPDTVPARYLRVADYLDLERVDDPRISPDGSEIIYGRSHVNRMEDRWASELWIMNADGSRQRSLAEGSSPEWSPDGSRIAYLKEASPKGSQLFVRWMDAGGATSQVTRVTEGPTTFEWSPEGDRIAFVALVPDEETWSIPMPPPPESASWVKPPVMLDKTHYRQDRRGFLEEGYTHLFVVPATGGTPRQITRGDWNVGPRFSGLRIPATIDWTPDGRWIVFDGLRQGDAGGVRYNQGYIYAANVESGEVRRLVSRKGNWTGPAVSPNGEVVAFAGHPYTEQTYMTSELWVVPFEGGEPRKISGSLDRDVGSLHWAADGGGVYFSVRGEGSQNVYFASLEGEVRRVTEGEHVLSLSSVSDDGAAAGVLSAPQNPGDVARIDLGDGRTVALTHVNRDVLAGKTLGEVEEIRYASPDGTEIQGWIVRPPEFDPEETYPLILHIHGGPHGMYDVGFSYPYQTFAAHGYVVLYTNPRGSTGYGTEFGNAIDRAYPSVDHDDLMAGVDAVIERGYVDTDRLYVTGCSGGGVLSAWAIGHTDRFAAAAVRCPVVNWISFAGTADVVQWGYHRFGGYFWDDPSAWLRHSPIMYVGNVSTPTLLMTGVLDLRTPISQTEEYYAALKVLGVEAVMLRFHEEYHGTTSRPSNAMRTQLYIMDWFEKEQAADVAATSARATHPPDPRVPSLKSPLKRGDP